MIGVNIRPIGKVIEKITSIVVKQYLMIETDTVQAVFEIHLLFKINNNTPIQMMITVEEIRIILGKIKPTIRRTNGKC